MIKSVPKVLPLGVTLLPVDPIACPKVNIVHPSAYSLTLPFPFSSNNVWLVMLAATMAPVTPCPPPITISLCANNVLTNVGSVGIMTKPSVWNATLCSLINIIITVPVCSSVPSNTMLKLIQTYARPVPLVVTPAEQAAQLTA